MHLKTAQHFLFSSLLLGVAMAQEEPIEQQISGFSSAIGAKVNLYAAEPLVKNPVHMNWDARGRLWVVNSSLEPESNEGQIVILEDTTQDGKADTSTLFLSLIHI